MPVLPEGDATPPGFRLTPPSPVETLLKRPLRRLLYPPYVRLADRRVRRAFDPRDELKADRWYWGQRGTDFVARRTRVDRVFGVAGRDVLIVGCGTGKDVPSWLEMIVQKLLAKSPADRFESATEVAELLEQCLAHLYDPTVVPLPEAARIAPDRSSRLWRNVVVSAVAGSALVLIAGLGFATRSFWSATPAGTDGDPQGTGPSSALQAPVPAELLRWDDDLVQGLTELEGDMQRMEFESESLLASPEFELQGEVAK